MQLIRGLQNIPEFPSGSAVTIGNFDGVHLGHRAVLAQLDAAARERAVPRVLVTFEPQPQEFFQGADAPPRLTRFRDKFRALTDCPLDYLVCLRFDAVLAGMSAEEFAGSILLGRLGTRFLLVGDDFRFGRGRHGDFALLQAMGAKHHFDVARMVSYCVDERRVSSTWVRERLTSGDFDVVAKLLGRRFTIEGRVAHGEKLGRQLGCPTANIVLRHRAVPLWGIFAVRVTGDGLRNAAGVASVGTRPTVNGMEPLLEVHILDFNGDLYGRHLRVEFLAKFREQIRFDNLDALKQKIADDVVQTREYFAHHA